MPDVNLYDDEFHPSPWQSTWREFKQSHIALVGLTTLSFFVVLAILGPILTPYAPDLQNTTALLLPPAWHDNGSVLHLLGTDVLGRDMLSRIIYGIQVTFGGAVGAVLFALIIGTAFGVIAGMTSGVRSSILNHVLDTFMVIPSLLIAIIIVAILGVGLSNAVLAIGLALIPRFVHATRNFIKEEFNKDYIKTARLDGASSVQIYFKNILPNMIDVIIVQGTLAISVAILDIAALGFLNLGAQTLLPELGVMISEGLATAYIAPWNILLPGLSIFLMVISINVVGDGLRSALRNRMSQ
ncbi:ABC transporter permease subunit [Opacimonas viscosa]|uniref:ABC transporter permease subunit n=1 Tax=Opacimonas viscosa TaxID=2961944 RepID=A0AA41WYX1_9ALTE|nr:ABC transporter permease subunit [Opacimonas viscosa]MCP3429079.1 ABC transporter permease subunit [Opacimonas viscosa]